MKINFSPPDITQREIDAVVEVLKSGWITTGPKTKQFEREIAEYTDAAGAVCVNSATIGMELVLRYLGIGPGDEVITSAYTYTASASVIDHVGAKVVLADCQKDSFLIDYDDVAAKITARTKAIIPVNIAGVMADSAKLIQIAEGKRHLFQPKGEIQEKFGRIIILSDSAHSFGSTCNGKKSGSIADFSCFSFHAVKNLTTAEGGAITWKGREDLDNDEVYKEFMLWALHGQDKDALAKTEPGAWEYDIKYPGYKGNMTDIMAAMGLVQLERYPELLARRKQIIARYDRRLSEVDGFEPFQHFRANMTSSGHLYLVNLTGKSVAFRNRVIELMDEREIATNVHYKPLPMMTAYKAMGFDIADFPNAYHRYENEITLPLHTLLSDEDVEYVMDNFIQIVKDLAASGNY